MRLRLKSRKISRAALWPGAPVTPPPGWPPARGLRQLPHATNFPEDHSGDRRRHRFRRSDGLTPDASSASRLDRTRTNARPQLRQAPTSDPMRVAVSAARRFVEAKTNRSQPESPKSMPTAINLPSRSPEPVMIATPLAGRERDRPSKARATSMTPAAAAAWAFRSGQRSLQVDPATTA
jgi:hypothetical protein